MISKAEKQRQFVTLFLFGLLADLLVSIAVASKDDVWSHLALIWTGPADDILFAIVALQAFLFLLDPTGAKTQDPSGEYSTQKIVKLLQVGDKTEHDGATNFTRGAQRALLFLSPALMLGLVLSAVLESAVTSGLLEVLQRHLNCVLPVFVVLIAGGAFLRLIDDSTTFWKVSLLGCGAIVVMAFHEGRFANYFYHLISNIESFYAWSLAFAWAGFLCPAPGAEIGQAEVA